MTNEEAKAHMDMSIAHKDMALKYHTCGRCKWENLRDEFYPCNKCIHSEDKREDYWQYAESEDEE